MKLLINLKLLKLQDMVILIEKQILNNHQNALEKVFVNLIYQII